MSNAYTGGFLRDATGALVFTTVSESVATTAASGATLTLDSSAGTIQDVTLTANCTLTFPTPAAGKSLTVLLKQDATGSRTVTWDAAVSWGLAGAPALSTTPAATDVFSFLARGAAWLGFPAGYGF